MANKKATGPVLKVKCNHAKGGGTRAVMPDVHLSDPLPSKIVLQAVDAAGAVVTIGPNDSVTATLVSDNVAFTLSPGADDRHYTATITPSTPSGTVANLAGTEKGTIQGAPFDGTSSVKVFIDLPPVPVAVDLQIAFE